MTDVYTIKLTCLHGQEMYGCKIISMLQRSLGKTGLIRTTFAKTKQTGVVEIDLELIMSQTPVVYGNNITIL